MKVHAHHMRSIFDTSFLWSRLMRRRLRPSLLGWISFSTKCCTKGTIYTSGGVQRKRVLLSDDVFQICNILKPSYVSAGLIQAYCECGIIEITTFHCFYLRGIKIWRHPIRIRKGNLRALKRGKTNFIHASIHFQSVVCLKEFHTFNQLALSLIPSK